MDHLRKRLTCKARFPISEHLYENVTIAYLSSKTGEYKTILQLVGVLSYGKVAKRLTDLAIDKMQDVQNLRKAIYE
jgi:hypothetical protein